MRIGALVFAGFLTVLDLQAHDVGWWENPYGDTPTNAMVLGYDEAAQLSSQAFIVVEPDFYEPCSVVVNLNPVTSTLISAKVFAPNPFLYVFIQVSLARPPVGSVEQATVTGEWHATGQPIGYGCDATNPQPFSVPVDVISVPSLKWQIAPTADGSIKIDVGEIEAAVQSSSDLTGPYYNSGLIKNFFIIQPDMPDQFFRGLNKLGGVINGNITDPSGNPLSGLTVGLPYGGRTTTTDANGFFGLKSMPWGTNLIAMWQSLTNVVAGTNTTNSASLIVEWPATNGIVAGQFKVKMDAGPGAGVPACNCTPWCAIGFGTLNGVQTPVYYAGGANSPKGVPANCDQPQVTVTPPNGTSYPINSGSGRHQNSGPNPPSGTWTVTSTVCGQTKKCTVTVP